MGRTHAGEDPTGDDIDAAWGQQHLLQTGCVPAQRHALRTSGLLQRYPRGLQGWHLATPYLLSRR